jgi:uncharacterized protein (TIGR02611 family)
VGASGGAGRVLSRRRARTVVGMSQLDAPPRPARKPGRLGGVRARVRALPGGRLAWRIGVSIIGAAVIAGGVVLLPLPGPGWLIIFAGLGILATEYAWAARLLGWVRSTVRQWTAWLGARPLWVRILVGVLLLAVVVAIGLGVWVLLR